MEVLSLRRPKRLQSRRAVHKIIDLSDPGQWWNGEPWGFSLANTEDGAAWGFLSREMVGQDWNLWQKQRRWVMTGSGGRD